MMYDNEGIISRHMAKEERLIFRLGTELRATVRAYADHYERAEADVIREALWLFLESKGYRRARRMKGGTRKK